MNTVTFGVSSVRGYRGKRGGYGRGRGGRGYYRGRGGGGNRLDLFVILVFAAIFYLYRILRYYNGGGGQRGSGYGGNQGNRGNYGGGRGRYRGQNKKAATLEETD